MTTKPPLDEALAPPGYRAAVQTPPELHPMGIDSCDGCAFAGDGQDCGQRPCSKYERPDGLSVVFKKVQP